MAAIAFPTTIRKPSYGITPEWDRPILESPFEDGSVQTRVKYTKGRDSFTIPWEHITQAEYDNLENFYKVTTAFGSLPFTFELPKAVGVKTITCRFVEKPTATLSSYDSWKVSIKVQEV